MDFSRYENLRTLVRANFSEQTRALVDEALVYADGKLTGLCRYDGTPLLDHAVAVAMVVISEVGLGRNSTVSAILHDVVRLAHKQLPAEEFLALTADIRDRFGEQVVGLTMGLANISELKLKVAKEQADNFRDLLVSYSEDPRVILIKLADRLEVMRSLEMFPREKWRKKSWESMNLYAQIAHKLGLYSLKSELEDIALKYLEPKDYDDPEKFVCSGENTITRPFKVSERYPDFEKKYVKPALKWWKDFVESGISPVFDERKDAEILKALRTNNLSPETDMAALVKEAEDLKAKLDAHAAEVVEDEKRYKVLTDMIKKAAIAQFRDGDKKVSIAGSAYNWEVSRTSTTKIDKDAMKADGILAKYTTTEDSYRISPKALKEGA